MIVAAGKDWMSILALVFGAYLVFSVLLYSAKHPEKDESEIILYHMDDVILLKGCFNG